MSSSPFFVQRAPYAEDPAKSRGRRFQEDESRTRTPFARDRDRIIHTSAFRRLKEKTQVFVAHEGDNFRTRLTHSLEVAQVARSLATALGLDSDLAETIALGHDIGHPPFGHAGEDELQACMKAFGGFDHNVQTFRVVTELERRYPDFHGLNLTWETLEGIIKHNGPVTEKLGKPSWKAISKYDSEYKLGLNTWASAEAQVAALADDIAYNNHDVDDGVEAGLFTLDELMDVPLIGPILAAVRSERPGPRPAPDPPGGRAPDDRRHGRRRDGRDPAARRRHRRAVGRGRPQPGPRPGRLLAGHGRGPGPAAPVPARPHVPPLARQSDAEPGAPHSGRDVRACSWPSPTSCRRNGSPGRRTATRPAAPAWSATTSRA
jgi:putative nucleotidyltransferase with HDIG domain